MSLYWFHMENVIETRELTKVYSHKTVLDHVNFKIRQGSIMGLVGKNGAGKTTLIRLLTDVAHPTSGTYSIMGESDPKKLVRLRAAIAAMVETPALYLSMSAHDNLYTRCILMAVPPKDMNAYINAKLDFVGLGFLKDSKKHARDFSLGQRQRLGIAMALVGDPKLLILDEPTNGLDPEGIREIRELLLNLNQQGITILISSHILSELSKLATDYTFIDNGKIIKEISAHDLETASKRNLEIVTDDDSKAKKILLDEGFELIGKSGLNVTGYTESAEVIMALTDKGLRLKSIKEKGGELEDYFVGLVDGGNNNGKAA
ncbi:MAG: putative ABC transporter ATP-binding protein YxlF [Tenericutes bacterium ADurb.BinA155]|jgi:ABC-2 type transport system ATP-binding protein|nr:MAG: putative ABC transporter ATP-binding protein YxlF [Tenericutes bacterium ADurb.BinA155]